MGCGVIEEYRPFLPVSEQTQASAALSVSNDAWRDD